MKVRLGGYRDMSDETLRVPRLVFLGLIRRTIHYIWYSAIFSSLNVGRQNVNATLMFGQPRVSFGLA